ncbi:MAG: type IX secretion system sortase PorU [Crocinitomicaceae bacterium]|nr:type IX secretion system sortase PorU [Crocinitomicaceae bacterium]
MIFRLPSILIFIISIISWFDVYSQTDEKIKINWLPSKHIKTATEELIVPTIQDQVWDNGKPTFYLTKKSVFTSAVIELVNMETVPAPNEDVTYLNQHNYLVKSDLQVDKKTTSDGKNSFIVISLFPYVLKNNTIHRIKEFEIQQTATESSVSSLPTKSFKSSSVLKEGSGTWYKINVPKDGIYKIDKAFLESCGIPTAGLNPNNINVYGNGEGKLPESNAVYRSDDLVKNAIFVSGDTDGSFDANDFILFYGWGPDRMVVNNQQFINQKNIYSDQSFYFININPNELPLRIATENSSNLPVTHAVTSFSHFDSYEKDVVNLVGGGQRWYGELFDVDLSQTFNFLIPNIVTAEPIKYRVSYATNARSGSLNTISTSVNGTIISSSNVPITSYDYIFSEVSAQYTAQNSTLPLTINFTRSNPSSLLYLDRIFINARRQLKLTGNQMNFRDLQSVGMGNVAEFSLTNTTATSFVWDITNRQKPKSLNGSFSATSIVFKVETDTLREFVVSNGLGFYVPEKIGPVAYQDLHSLPQADYLIVTHKDFSSQAERLASLHRASGLTVHVATTEQIFNEFSSGMLDPTAIRYFAKMFYDRGASAISTRPKYLLLFGDGTYDPKNRVDNNNNFVPTYQFLNAEQHLDALVSDDYYGMLDDNDAIGNADLLDIGVGRLLISDITMAKQQVDKIEHYLKNGSTLFDADYATTFGDWRNKYTLIADDEQGGYFVENDCEEQYAQTALNHPEMNCTKLYSDAFKQQITGGGERYPEVNEQLSSQVENGNILVNYVGHGGEVGFAEEQILINSEITNWKNTNKLNLFVSATCEFTKYDDPKRVSAGELVSMNPVGGAIAMMTTTRSIYVSVNSIIGEKFFNTVFERDALNKPQRFGDIIKIVKNTSGSSQNKRCFTLIGDPALRLALPEMKVKIDSINGFSPAIYTDTINALSKMTIKGHVEGYTGGVLTSFNGELTPTIFDKEKMKKTLGQNSESPVIEFKTQDAIIYKGKVSIVNGYFNFSFVVPKDIDYDFGAGKLSMYATNFSIDAAGQDKRFIIGGIDPIGINDDKGPDIQLFMNDYTFVNGGLTDEKPLLIAKLFDENGINTVGNGIGHDITVILDENTAQQKVLNQYYASDLDSYQSGEVRYNFSGLAVGKHTLKFKAWDVNNNSSSAQLDFTVNATESMALDHVLNYPNPFTTNTSFYFEHNQAADELDVMIQVFTISGKLVKTIQTGVKTDGFRSQGIAWDGLDDFGDQLARGVYIYVLKVKNSAGEVAEKTEKLVLLK